MRKTVLAFALVASVPSFAWTGTPGIREYVILKNNATAHTSLVGATGVKIGYPGTSYNATLISAERNEPMSSLEIVKTIKGWVPPGTKLTYLSGTGTTTYSGVDADHNLYASVVNASATSYMGSCMLSTLLQATHTFGAPDFSHLSIIWAKNSVPADGSTINPTANYVDGSDQIHLNNYVASVGDTVYFKAALATDGMAGVDSSLTAWQHTASFASITLGAGCSATIN